MKWFLISLIAPAVWAIGNIIDGYLIHSEDEEKGMSKGDAVAVLMLYTCLVGIVVSFGIFMLVPETMYFGIPTRFALLGVGILEGIGYTLYLRALLADDTSEVAAWFNLNPLVAGLGAWIFLGESVTGAQLVGAGILFISSILLSINWSGGTFKFKKLTPLLMITSVLMFSGAYILFESVANEAVFWAASFWQYLGMFIFGLFIILKKPEYFKLLVKDIVHKGKERFGLNMLNEGLSVAGNLIMTFAILLGPTGLVLLSGTYQPIFVVIFSLILLAFGVKVFGEKLDKRTILFKIAIFCVMIIGTYFMVS